MPVHYEINPELNMIIYVCRGAFTGREFFETSDRASLDPRRKHGMISIVDLYAGEDFVGLEDIQYGIKWEEKKNAEGFVPEKMAVLSQKPGIHMLVAAVNFMSKNVRLNFKAFYTMQEALRWLGMLSEEIPVLQLWMEAKAKTGEGVRE